MKEQSATILKYFGQICSIPHGSGNMKPISDYCISFAEQHGLSYICDKAKNVIIYKDASIGYETAEPIILQAHLDMVCQSVQNKQIDFEKEGIIPVLDGDILHADGTTLGADNGISVAMMLTILADENLLHPPIEAVFTTDEEIGMVGAKQLDATKLSGKRMINLDAEEEELVTVSCAGGSDVEIELPTERRSAVGTRLTLEIRGLRGGHSGVEIDKERANANILMGRILAFANKNADFDIVKINGGNKTNAITVACRAELLTADAERLEAVLSDYFETVKAELGESESGCSILIEKNKTEEAEVLSENIKDKLIYILSLTPNGVQKMSTEIEGLVETSLNLGILETKESDIVFKYAMRSNKKSALSALEDKMCLFAEYNDCKAKISGGYAPWQYCEASAVRELYLDAFYQNFGFKPKVYAIHAGLECAVFAELIDGLDCIAIGPEIKDAHTTKESVSVSSVEKIFEVLCDTLKNCK